MNLILPDKAVTYRGLLGAGFNSSQSRTLRSAQVCVQCRGGLKPLEPDNKLVEIAAAFLWFVRVRGLLAL